MHILLLVILILAFLPQILISLIALTLGATAAVYYTGAGVIDMIVALPIWVKLSVLAVFLFRETLFEMVFFPFMLLFRVVFPPAPPDMFRPRPLLENPVQLSNGSTVRCEISATKWPGPGESMITLGRVAGGGLEWIKVVNQDGHFYLDEAGA